MSDSKEVKKSLKNTGLVGGSQVLTIMISLIKTKAIAVFLGPIGIGLIQLFTSILEMLNSLFGLGIAVSGVRNISEDMSTGNIEKLSRTVIVIKRWLWFSGLLGVVFTTVFSKRISYITFGSDKYWIELSLLSITIIFSNLASAHSTLVRGARNISDYIKINLISALVGTVIAVVIYYFFRESGIVAVLFVTSIITYIVNYVFSSKIKLKQVAVTLNQAFKEGGDMIKLGLFTVITGIVSTATLYYVRISIGEQLGIDSVGYYSVAISLTVTYMGIIFNAMSADYYPKLGAINRDDIKVNKAVLEQTKIVLILGTPLVLLMYTFTDLIIEILYTKEFVESIIILQWMLMSVFIRFLGYPIGYVFLAKGKSKIFIFTQVLWNILFLIFVHYSFIGNMGLEGIGMSFVLAYFIGIFINYYILHKLTEFRYDRQSFKYIIILSLATIVYFLVSYNFSGLYIFRFKLIGSLLVIIYSYKQIEKLIGVDLLTTIKSRFINK